MILKNLSITTTSMTAIAVVVIITKKNITTNIMSIAADMSITTTSMMSIAVEVMTMNITITIMQMKYLQAGEQKQLLNSLFQKLKMHLMSL